MSAVLAPSARLEALNALDARLRLALLEDSRVRSALAYGSRTQQRQDGQFAADAWSDLEYYAYVDEDSSFDALTFLASCTPVALAVVNPFGTPNIVTPDLLRVELHVAPVQALTQLRSWPNWGAQPQAMFIKDEDGQLMPMLRAWAAETRPLPPPQTTYDEVLGQLTGVAALVCRGEGLRASEWLTWVRGGLMRLIRWASSAPQPPAVTRWAEEELPTEWSQALGRLTVLPPVQACLMALVLAEELAARMQLDARPHLLAALRAQVQA